jgi:UDP-N-acetylmuramate dehydrogenase
MKIYRNFSLKPFNTFGIDVMASSFCKITNIDEAISMLDLSNRLELKTLVTGTGSNILYTTDFKGFVIQIANKGIKIIAEDNEHAWVEVMAGEDWDGFVSWCVGQNLGGLENLSYIPGQVGSSPVQNIGAYGTELKDVFESLNAIEIATGKIRNFQTSECNFGYRLSTFKTENKGKFIIWSVVFKLFKNPRPVITYPALAEIFAKKKISDPDILQVREAIITVRKNKLPEVAQTGSAGSFFKNPVISTAQSTELKNKYNDIQAFVSENGVKIAAGWLIEKCGWKGYRDGDAGVWPKQALVLVNYGNATGEQILSLALKITDSVEKTFEIRLEPEVNII